MKKTNRIFSIGQKVYCDFDGTIYDGTVKEVFEDHIVVDIPKISSHCWYEEGFNMDSLYLSYSEASASVLTSKEQMPYDYYEYAREMAMEI